MTKNEVLNKIKAKFPGNMKMMAEKLKQTIESNLQELADEMQMVNQNVIHKQIIL